MVENWRRPTELEAARGVIVVLICHEVMFAKGVNMPISHDLPYTATMLERRIKRGGGLPYWITLIA